MGVHHHWHPGFHLARFLAHDLSPTGRAPATVRGRTRIHPVRPGRTRDKNTLGPTRPAPADVGICHRQVHDRSDLVGISILDAEIPKHELWLEDHADRFAAGCDLRFGGFRLYRWRMALLDADQA